MRRNFTLIEMLIVITVIAILAAIGLKMMGQMTGQAQNEAAGMQIRKILAALEKFRGDFGAYPLERQSTDPGNRDKSRQDVKRIADAEKRNGLAAHLFSSVNSTGVNRKNPLTWHGDYLDKKDIPDVFISGDEILDYWKEQPLIYWLRYRIDPKTRVIEVVRDDKDLKKKLTPELWSKGGDGAANVECLSISGYEDDLHYCTARRPEEEGDPHAFDDDNVGGELNKMKVNN